MTEDEKENQQVAAAAAAAAAEQNNTTSEDQVKVADKQADAPRSEATKRPDDAKDENGDIDQKQEEESNSSMEHQPEKAVGESSKAAPAADDDKKDTVETAEEQVVNDASTEQQAKDDDMKTEHADKVTENEEVQIMKDGDTNTDSVDDNKKEEESSMVSSKRPLSEKEKDDTPLPRKPIKRARTAYFIFAEEKRPEVQKQHPGEGVAAVAKALGQIWASLSAEEKQVYQAKAAVERERVAKELQAYKDADIPMDAPLSSTEAASSLVFPVARIRKICKLDPDVRGLSKEGLLLVCKAAELATAKLGKESVSVAQMQNRRKLLPDDVSQVCATREQFMFLREDISDLARQQMKEAAAASKAKSASKTSSMPQSKPLTDFFGPAQPSDKS